TINALDCLLPPHWSHGNPVDLLADADPDRYAAALEIVSRDSNTDGVLVVLAPDGFADPTATAERLVEAGKQLNNRPLLAGWFGGPGVQRGATLLSQANIPVFEYPDSAARMFEYMWRYTCGIRGIYETPMLPTVRKTERAAGATVAGIITAVRREGRTLL